MNKPAKGGSNKVIGSVKEAIGKVTGKKKTAHSGKADKTKGKVEQKLP